ncbi:hypothetical protein AUH73_02310 [archaeon 13_1_40CM_4_53_4]|nr:MAG: hypothetical protein AUH73_02310 [archaeon 13_1_40CM_4_53_4]OLE91720.1 MAG: hypothetical protein AUF79_02785 [Crenarchaeota archaeon 13_1_20CM_2_51_8]
MKLLREKTGVTDQRIYQIIDEKKNAHHYSITKETAAYLIAAENGIDISKILKEDELIRVREVATGQPVINRQRNTIQRDSSKQILVEIGKDIKVTDPLLPKKIVEDAKRMAEVYAVVYVFENSVRNLISKVLETRGTDWWETNVGGKIKNKVKERIEKEQRNAWHGKRGAHPIFYADIDDLSSIIAANWADFRDIFPDQPWVSGKIAEIEMSRNVIAHNNPLEEHDINRLKINFGDWIRQISLWSDQQLAEKAESDTQE